MANNQVKKDVPMMDDTAAVSVEKRGYVQQILLFKGI